MHAPARVFSHFDSGSQYALPHNSCKGEYSSSRNTENHVQNVILKTVQKGLCAREPGVQN